MTLSSCSIPSCTKHSSTTSFLTRLPRQHRRQVLKSAFICIFEHLWIPDCHVIPLVVIPITSITLSISHHHKIIYIMYLFIMCKCIYHVHQFCYNSVLSPSFDQGVQHPQFWKRRKFPVGWQRWAPRRAKQRGRNKGSRTSVRPAQSNEVLHGDAGAMGDSSCGRDSRCVLFGSQFLVLACSGHIILQHDMS